MVRYKSVSFKDYSLSEREAFLQSAWRAGDEPHVLLQTCNRIEIYSGSGAVSRDVARYLFRLVSGLESSFVGETAIQGQVKRAYLDAKERYKLPASLHKLFQHALFVGKRVRSESALSQGAMSHSQAAIELIVSEKVALRHALITVLGANKLNEDVIRFLQSKGASSLFLSNRSYEKAEALASKYDCRAFNLDNKREFISFSDVLITATSAPHVIVRPEHIVPGRSLLIIDLAFPRDVDPAVADIPGVRLFDLEQIEQRIAQNTEARRAETELAERIIEEEVDRLVTSRLVNR